MGARVRVCDGLGWVGEAGQGGVGRGSSKGKDKGKGRGWGQGAN